MNEELQFDPGTHIYRLGARIIPSVTRTMDVSGLADYSQVRDDILERCGEVGTWVHRATLYYDEGSLDESTIRESIRPRVEAWMEFRAMSGFKPRLREHRCHFLLNGMLCGMTLDAEGTWGRDEVIIEIKTGKLQRWHRAQTAGYSAGCPMRNETESRPLSPFARFVKRARYVVELKANGKPKVHGPFDERRDFDAFGSALFITHWKMEDGRQIGAVV